MNFMHYMNTIVRAEETGWSCGAVQGADPGNTFNVEGGRRQFQRDEGMILNVSDSIPGLRLWMCCT